MPRHLPSVRKTSVDEGSLDQYLREISAYPLICREDEVDLAIRIRRHEEEALDKLLSRQRRGVLSGSGDER